MRYIDKSKNPCDNFIRFVEKHKAKLGKWDDLKNELGTDGSEMYEKLHNHLVDEQQGLCIYCEQEINTKPFDKDTPDKFSQQHIEHVIPKVNNPRTLSFDYGNLAVSCGGFEHSRSKTKQKPQYCGHKKGDKYNELLFLNPFQEKDLIKYFVYRIKEDGTGIEIRENSKLSPEEQKKAEYMIRKNLLDLNNPSLCDLRKIVYDEFIAKVTFSDEGGLVENSQKVKQEVKQELREDIDELHEFHSMLRYMFRDNLLPTDN